MPTVNVHEAKTPHDRPKRRLGALEGLAVIPADFDAPLADEVIAVFEGQ